MLSIFDVTSIFVTSELPVSVVDNLRVTQKVDPRSLQRQQSLRERAKRNPYIAASLLGGLGSAGLL